MPCLLILCCDIQLSLKYIHTGQTEMLCSHLGNAYSILVSNRVDTCNGDHSPKFTQQTGVARVPTVVSGAFYYRLDVCNLCKLLFQTQFLSNYQQ